jgi:hypothetical protein
VSFIELFCFLENRLGYHQFPVYAQAKEISELFESSAAHHELVVRLARDIYKANHCQKLAWEIDKVKTEAVLTRIRLDILNGNKTDIDLYHFIEDICVAVYEFFTGTEHDTPSIAQR